MHDLATRNRSAIHMIGQPDRSIHHHPHLNPRPAALCPVSDDLATGLGFQKVRMYCYFSTPISFPVLHHAKAAGRPCRYRKPLGINNELLVCKDVTHTLDTMPVNVRIVCKQLPFSLFVDRFEVLSDGDEHHRDSIQHVLPSVTIQKIVRRIDADKPPLYFR